MNRIFFKRIATTVAVTGMMLVGSNLVGFAAPLKDGDTVNGFIRANSPSFRFRNESRTGSPVQAAPGEEYTFNAQPGDTITISVDPEDGSTLSPVLVLLASDTGRQVAYDDVSGSLRYRVPVAGEYRLLVLGQNNTRGRYTLSISGINSQTAQNPSPSIPSSNDPRRQLLQNDYGLRVLDSCPPATGSLVVVSFPETAQTYRYCANPTRLVRAGEYTYDAASGELKPGAPVAGNTGSTTNDPRRQILQNEYGLRVLDNCPPATGSLVVVSFPETAQTYRYCAHPTRLVRAGEYTYDPTSGELRPGAPIAGNSSSGLGDRRRQLLQNEFGLRVLDNCPPATGSLVVVSYPEASQNFRYCANPTRDYPAGEYVYNSRINDLEAASATDTSGRCRVEVGGICVVR
jgi:hypothetical protein